MSAMQQDEQITQVRHTPIIAHTGGGHEAALLR
jgi:hypothetical protein